MINRHTLLVATITSISIGSALAQSTPPQPADQPMGNMPGMSGGSSADMAATMKQCAQMKSQMKAGMKMTPAMQPMMDKCNKMDASMGTTKAPDDTLSR